MDKIAFKLWDKITEYPTNTWIGFWRILPFGFILILIFDNSLLLPFINKYFPTISSKYIIIASFSAIVLYIFYFLVERIILQINIIFSKKINIVLAYNLESVLNLNKERFQRKYNNFIIELKNYIRINNLGKTIKLKVAPPDIKLNGTSAEAKTKLGLLGSTLLVWGYVTHHKGNTDFKTKFSYEFGYSTNLPKDKARDEARKYIESFNMLRPISNRFATFEGNLFLTCLFILGFSTFTVGDFKKSEYILETFIFTLKASNLMTQRDFAAPYEEVKKFLMFIYKNKLRDFIGMDSILNNKETIDKLVHKVTGLEKRDYAGNTYLSLLAELEGDRSNALQYNEIARGSASDHHFSHIFNDAYFALTDGEFSKAIEIYCSIPKDEEDLNLLTSQISNFMDYQFNLTKKLEFFFADGYVSYLWDDESRGIKILREFARRAKDPYLEILKTEANRILDLKSK